MFTYDKSGTSQIKKVFSVAPKERTVFFIPHLCATVGDTLNWLRNIPEVKVFM